LQPSTFSGNHRSELSYGTFLPSWRFYIVLRTVFNCGPAIEIQARSSAEITTRRSRDPYSHHSIFVLSSTDYIHLSSCPPASLFTPLTTHPSYITYPLSLARKNGSYRRSERLAAIVPPSCRELCRAGSINLNSAISTNISSPWLSMTSK